MRFSFKNPKCYKMPFNQIRGSRDSQHPIESRDSTINAIISLKQDLKNIITALNELIEDTIRNKKIS